MIWRKKVLLRANFSFFHSVQYRHRQHNIISPKIRESKTNFTNEITDDVIWRNIFGGINCVIFLSHCASKNVKFSLSENNFVNSTVCLVTSLVKMLLSRNFCQKSVRNFCQKSVRNYQLIEKYFVKSICTYKTVSISRNFLRFFLQQNYAHI